MLAVVVTHQGRRWLKDCLISLNAQSYEALDVLVVDDASPDVREQPHLKRIVKRHLRRRRWGFLRTRRPLGFGGAANWAMSRVRTDADLLLFLHDDVALDRDSVEQLVGRMMADVTTAIVGPKIVAWDDPSCLEEVGMAVDRFGYPYKGLERGEIDLGQHDVASEVFYVTSTVTLVRHSVFRDLRGWDGRMKAFSEDLDLCWRARLAGHSVMVEPRARARHAIALATGQRRSRFRPTRYYIRRNRLRAVAKNASGLRLVGLVPQFVLLSLTEMVGFIVLRQPSEILHLVRAWGWNFVTAPQTLTERLRVQRTRRISDGRLRRFTVREFTRVRAYVSAQTERLEDAWGRRTELVARRSREARAATRSLRGWPAVAALVALTALALGFRHLLWSPPVAVGDLLPYPEGVTALWRAYASPWQASGLGSPGPTSPALLLLGTVPLLTLGAAGAAQKLLLVALAAAGFAGAYHLLAGLADKPSRLVAGLSYLFGPLGFAGIRSGALGALAFGAVAPFALRALLEATGWSRPPGWDPGRGTARIALTAAVAGAFVPGAIPLLAGVALVLAVLRLLLVPAARTLAGALVALAGAAVALLLLLPWSATWAREDGPLAGAGGDSARAAFTGHDIATVVLGRTPEAPAAVGLALAVLAVIALLLGTGQRRRVGLALAAVVVASGWAVTAIAKGVLPSPVAGPTEAGALAAASYSGLAGLAVAAFRLDLPRRRLGWMQPVAIAALAIAGALALAGLAPQVWRGGWTPGRGAGTAGTQVATSVRALIAAEAGREGPFRVLWVGERFAGSEGAWGAGEGRRIVTGPSGETLADLFANPAGEGPPALAAATTAVERGTTDLGGHLVGAFNVRYVVLGADVEPAPWLAQRDLAVIREEPEYLVLSNAASLPRSAVFDDVPPYVMALRAGNPALGAREAGPPRSFMRRMNSSTYEGRSAGAAGVLWLAESADRGWRASLGERPLRRAEGGWGNVFVVPEGEGDLRLSFGSPAWQGPLIVAVALAWVVVVGAAASKRTGLEPAAR